jgi:hypothetical protein
LLQTRISGIRHLLEVVGNSKESHRETTVVAEMPLPEQAAPPEMKSGASLLPVQHELKENETIVVDEVVRVTDNQTIPEQHVIPHPPATDVSETKNETLAPSQEIGLEEEADHLSEKHILAEKFVAGKSLNDLLLEKTRFGFKFSNMPLTSLVSSIGTNEKFLFTRELFDGNMESFSETVQKLDAMDTIREAADFLRDNFKWKKSETSLRFIDLIKRRFNR